MSGAQKKFHDLRHLIARTGTDNPPRETIRAHYCVYVHHNIHSPNSWTFSAHPTRCITPHSFASAFLSHGGGDCLTVSSSFLSDSSIETGSFTFTGMTPLRISRDAEGPPISVR